MLSKADILRTNQIMGILEEQQNYLVFVPKSFHDNKKAEVAIFTLA